MPTHLIGNDAFQECDTVGITRPCTKHNYLVKSIADLPRVLHEAFHIAASGRPGPVVVDIPKDIQFAKGIYSRPKEFAAPGLPAASSRATRTGSRQAVELMARAKRPLFYTGGGVINSGPQASALLRELVKLTGFPITSTLMGLGAYPASDPQWLGMLGMHGTWEANWAMHDCDLMICIGARFDDRITGRLDAFSPGSKKIHVDIDPSSINKNVKVDVPIIGDCAHVLEDMLAAVARAHGAARQEGARPTGGSRSTSGARASRSPTRTRTTIIKPQYAIQRLYELTKDRDTYITTEVGQHQMWAAQFYHFEEPNRWMTSGGLGTMGYGLPAVGRRAARASEVAGHRHRRRGLGADDHAGNVDGGAVPAADQDLHPQQPVHGHGAAVAGAAARRPLRRELHRMRCRISSSSPRPITRVGIRCEKPGDLDAAIKEMIDVDRAGDLRLRGRSERELLPDDPVRPRPQRDDPGRRRRERRGRHHRRRQGDGVDSPPHPEERPQARLEGWLPRAIAAIASRCSSG